MTDNYNIPARYAVDDGDGNRLMSGLTENNAQTVAKKIANKLGEPVYLYSTREGDEDMTPEEVDPTND